MKLSVVIPVYNERETLGAVCAAVSGVLPEIDKQIVIVDDGSTDGTRDWIASNIPDGHRACAGVTLDDGGALIARPPDGAGAGRIVLQTLLHAKNAGKGAALRSGFALVEGDVCVIQDADLEYDPADWVVMWDLIMAQKVADVVFGSRFYGAPHRSLTFHHYAGNRLISFLFSILYDQTLKDVEVCYKMMSATVLRSLSLSADDFGIEIEISARIARARRWRIYETGISYRGRDYSQGKKIGWRDGLKALWYVLRYRFD